jgi:peptidoglycan/xylan/chitin deacetylase (PgdA/CDA1 family)
MHRALPIVPERNTPSDRRRRWQQAAIAVARFLLDKKALPRLSILIFHRVLPAPDPLFANDPDAHRFAELMRVIRDHFSPLSLAEAVERLRLNDLPPRAVCVTFDDGYADNLTVAAPILAELGVPATVFIASGYLDGGIMWNDRVMEAVRRCPDAQLDLADHGLGNHAVPDGPERAALAEQLLRALKYRPHAERERVAADLAARYAPNMTSPMLTRVQLRQLHASGIEIGGHTVTHPILALSDKQAAYEEIASNKEDLESLLGERLELFAYPNGNPEQDFASAHVEMVRRAGYAAAVTTRPSVCTSTTDPFWLPRFTPWQRDPVRFATHLLLSRRAIV